MTIPLSLDGTSQASDYTLSSENVVFAPGDSTASVILDITDDSDFEISELIIASFESSLPVGVALGVSNSIAVTIPRNDFDTTVSVTTTAREVAEGESLILEFTRTAGDQTEALTIPLTVSGGAQAEDYTLSSENVVFAPGDSTASVTLEITDDPGFEALETVIVALGVLPSETSLGTPNSVTITIPETIQTPK